jgi:UDP-N-acetyl-D-glucosamine dehydrogenase
MTPMDDTEFDARVAARSLVVGVVGLGYVGLPLAVAHAESGFTVVGFDIDAERTDALNTGRSHIEDIADERLAAQVSAGRFAASADRSVLDRADVVFICVPTPSDRHQTPDLSYVRAALTSVAASLRPGKLVILQSTTYPGTTTEVGAPALEAAGLRAGVDFHLAFSPERVDPGNAEWTVATTPKVVGGLTPECGRRAALVLESLMRAPEVRQVSTPAAAEMAKLLENTYRAVNIALVNELAQLCHRMGIDVWEVVDAAATKPFGFEAFRPGIGPGGHCIPVDPQYLSWKAREFDFRTEFIDLAADTNQGMADYVLGRIRVFADRHGLALAGARVLCLGAAFKAGVSDIRNSRAIRVMELLVQADARIEFADPLVDELEVSSERHKAVAIGPAMAAGFDLVVVLVAHAQWAELRSLPDTALVFDAVGAIEARGHPAYERL